MSNTEEEIIEILASIKALSSPYKRGLKLASIASKLITTNTLSQALEIVSQIREPEPCAHALSMLIPRLNENQVLEALRIASSINTSSSDRTNSISMLSSRVTPDMIPEALKIARQLVAAKGYLECSDFLVAILPTVPPKLLQEVLSIAYEIDNLNEREGRIHALSELNQILAQSSNSSTIHSDIFLPYSIRDFDSSYRARMNELIDTRFCNVPRARAKILMLLYYYVEGEQRTQVFERLIETIEEIPAQPCKARSLMALAPHLPENLARRVAKRAFMIVKEIVEDIGRDTQVPDSPLIREQIKEVESQLQTLPISTLLSETLRILQLAEGLLFDSWWTPSMIEGVPPKPIPTPRQTILLPNEYSRIIMGEIGSAGAGIRGDFGGLLGDETIGPIDEVTELMPVIQPSITEESVPPSKNRYLNAGIKDRELNEPLVVDETYLLEFGVDIEKGASFSTVIPSNEILMKDDETTIDLTIQLDGDDFDIAPSTRTLKLPRYGASKKISFAITPKQERRSTLTATVHKNGNLVLEMELTFPVGSQDAKGTTTSVHGRLLGAAQYLKPRELGVRCKPVEAGYECTIWGAVSNQVVLPLNPVEIRALIDRARAAMMDVVMYTDTNNKKIFQTMIDIDATSSAAALKTLAFAGAELFKGLFYGPLAGPDVKNVGDYLKKLAMKDTPLKLQIVAENFPVPWGLLYFGETRSGAKLDWNNFLGMRHIIEQIPRLATLDVGVDDCVIKSNNPSLSVSLNVNVGIDKQMNFDGVARQVKDWVQRSASSRGAMVLTQRQTTTDLLAALSSLSNDQLMYFYCHANTANPADQGGPWSSFIELTNRERVTLADLNREAPMDQALPGNPLIFINACESAEISPEFYDGFVPYFMAKGARGVVGTECKMPALFATEWALLFFPRFLGGAPLGELFLELRQEFCKQHGNPLGLLYTVYCNGDTYIKPGLN